jgi:hypothetical protein
VNDCVRVGVRACACVRPCACVGVSVCVCVCVFMYACMHAVIPCDRAMRRGVSGAHVRPAPAPAPHLVLPGVRLLLFGPLGLLQDGDLSAELRQLCRLWEGETEMVQSRPWTRGPTVHPQVSTHVGANVRNTSASCRAAYCTYTGLTRHFRAAANEGSVERTSGCCH